MIAAALALALVQAPPAETLQWDAPVDCPDVAAVRARVEARLGRPLPAADDGDAVHARAKIVRGTDGFDLELAIESSSGARTRALHSRDCEVLAQTTALLVAVAIDPAAGDDTEPETRVEPAPPVVDREPVATPPVIAPRRVAPKPPPRLRGALRLLAGVAYGPLPGVAPMIDATAALLHRRVRVELGFAWWFDRTTPLDDSDGDARLRLWTLALRGCWVPSWRWFELPLCGGAAAGARVALARSASMRESDRAPWFAFEAGTAAVFVPARPIALRIGADLVVPVTRGDLVVAERAVAHEPAPAGIRALAGVEARFP